MRRTAVGIGEFLWDHLPGGKRPGGAPGNFARHMQAFGYEAVLVSRVGDDDAGREALSEASSWGLDTSFIAVDPSRPTGTSTVRVDAMGVPAFTVRENVAWDGLAFTEALGRLASRAVAVYFGTLGQRAAASRDTTRRFVERTRPGAIRLFDLNLRAPHYSDEVISWGLEAASAVKMNEDELSRVSALAGLGGGDAARIPAIAERFGLRGVALTRGARGALVFVDGAVSEEPAPVVNVVDTVGAGDAFTAAFVAGLLEGRDAGEINRHANRVAAFVCSQAGATPVLPDDLLHPTA